MTVLAALVKAAKAGDLRAKWELRRIGTLPLAEAVVEAREALEGTGEDFMVVRSTYGYMDTPNGRPALDRIERGIDKALAKLRKVGA